MIHNIILLNKNTGEIYAKDRYWKIDIDDNHIQEFLVGRKQLDETSGLSVDTPLFADKHKIFHYNVDDNMSLLFFTDGKDEERVIKQKVREAAKRIETSLRWNFIDYVRDNLSEIIGELIFTRLKIAFVGSGGVGKTTLLRLLFGKEPAPGGYTPTINVSVDSSETIQFGTFLFVVWDFAGQAVFQDLWEFYFQGTDMIFLVTDSSFRNVMQTKTLLKTIRGEAPESPIFIIANKQDLPESMESQKIQRLLGAPTVSMVATDKEKRKEFIKLILEVATKMIGVQMPSMPIEDMIMVKRLDEKGQIEDADDKPEDDNIVDDVIPTEEEIKKERETIVLRNEKVLDFNKITQTNIYELILSSYSDEKITPIIHLPYSEKISDTENVLSLISALDSFGGIESQSSGIVKGESLMTIEHHGDIVIVEKTESFLAAIVSPNDIDEGPIRERSRRLLQDVEIRCAPIKGVCEDSEYSIFDILWYFPLFEVKREYIPRKKSSGRPLPVSNCDIGRTIVEVNLESDGRKNVGEIINLLKIQESDIIGCLQLLYFYGWIDFRVDINENTILKKKTDIDKSFIKIYGQEIERFVDICDGTITFEEAVNKIRATMQSMSFIVQKIVLSGALEIV